MIESDLKIDEFIHDKATLASLGNTSDAVDPSSPPFSTLSEQIVFVSSFGGNATPTWKFARVTANPAGNLVSATRTNTDSVTITIGEVTPGTRSTPTQLKGAAAQLHNAGVGANLNGTQIRSQTPQ